MMGLCHQQNKWRCAEGKVLVVSQGNILLAVKGWLTGDACMRRRFRGVIRQIGCMAELAHQTVVGVRRLPGDMSAVGEMMGALHTFLIIHHHIMMLVECGKCHHGGKYCQQSPSDISPALSLIHDLWRIR